MAKEVKKTKEVKKEPTRGVVLMALNYCEYGHWASTLANSLRFTSPDIKIALICDPIGKRDIAPAYDKDIDQYIPIPENYYKIDGRNIPLKAKTFIYDLSPFDETIFIDADLIWLPYKPITELFEKFKDIDFTMSCRSDARMCDAYDTLIHWAKPRDILAEYPDLDKEKRMYNVSSEFIYFKKNQKVKDFFELVKQFYLEPKVSYRDFGLQVPDELAYTLAMLHSDIKPHESPFVPMYWEPFHRIRLNSEEMYNKYYGYSAGGNILDNLSKDFYNNLAKMYAQRRGKKWHYPMRNKLEFIAERKTI